MLVTDSSYKHTLGACRALGSSGYQVQVIGPKFGQAGYSKWVEKRHLQRGYAPGDLSAQIAEISDSEGIPLLLPVGASSVFDVSAKRDMLSNKIAFALAPKGSIDLALNKADLLSFAESVGVQAPRTWRFDKYESLLNVLDEIPMPFIIKSAREQHKFGPIYIYSPSDVENLLAAEILLPEFTHGELVIQTLIKGPGEGFFALYQNGVCKRVMMHRRLREIPATGGSSWAAESTFRQDLFDSGVTLLDALKWHGPAMVEFKRNETDGQLSLMELNPKLWGSLDLAIASGVNFPADTVRIAAGEELESNFTYETGVKYVWPLENYARYRRDAALKAPDFKTNISKDDLLPTAVTVATNVAGPCFRWLSKTTLATVARWARKYDIHQLLSRIIGQLCGLPARTHCQVNEFLWVGAKPKLLGRMYLKMTHRHILSLVPAKSPRDQVATAWRTWLPLDEYVDIPLAKLDESSRVIMDLYDNDGKVFVHCREGVGRAPTVAAAFLISQGAPLAQALAEVRHGRDVAALNSLQVESLRAFARAQNAVS